MIVAAVPVKDVVNAKQRLMRVLDGRERRELARAMLIDVLKALGGAALDQVWVVTREPEVATLARSLGAEPLAEPENRGHTAAVATAQAEAARQGATAFLTIPGDVPCVSAAEIRTLVQALTAPPVVVLTPSRSGLGTNGVLLAPPSAMRLRFGEPSFDGHVVAARALRLDVRIVRLPGLGLDVDAPEDLSMLLAEGASHRERPPADELADHRAPGRRRRGRPALTMPPRYEVIGIEGIGEVRPGDDVARIVVEAAARQRTPLAAADVLVLSQKIVSKSEGRLLRLSEITPSLMAETFAAELGRDPRLIEVILRESRRIVRMDRGVLVTETRHGWVCANAGVDQSNVDADMVALLPEDSDRSARGIRETLRTLVGGDVHVIIADTFGRPWREGLVNIAIGVAGFAPHQELSGRPRPRRAPAAGHHPGHRRRAGRRRRAGDGQARPHPGGPGARPAAGAERGRLQGAAARSRSRPLPIGDERP